MSTRTEIVTPSLLRGWQLSHRAADKNERGTVLVIGGARRTPGAAMLAGLAALRSGAGRLVLAVAEPAAMATALAVPESAVIGLPEDRHGPGRTAVLRDDVAAADAVVVGPGLDDAEETAALLRDLAPLLTDGTPLVLDAYALGVLPGLEDIYQQWGGRMVLTPNRVEAGRLLGRRGVTMATAVPRIAQKYQAVVSGHGMIADPQGRLWEVAGGNAGLGTSGSGDVLAGTVGGFLARKATPAQAACWGTYLHATAGDRLSASIGPMNYLARELLDAMPAVLQELST